MGNALAVRSFEKTEIEARLATGTAEQILSVLEVLISQWPNIRDESGGALRIRGYVLALEGFGLATIKACVKAAIRGELGNPAFMPLAPEMAAWCRLHERADRETLVRIAREDAQFADRKALPDYGSRERISRGFEALSKSLERAAIESKLELGRDVRSLTAEKEIDNGNRGGDQGSRSGRVSAG